MLKWQKIKVISVASKCLVTDFCSIALGSCPVYIKISVVQNPVPQVSTKHQLSSDLWRGVRGLDLTPKNISLKKKNASVNQTKSKSITTYERLLTWIRENIAIKCTGGISLESIAVTQCETVFPQCCGPSKHNRINSKKHVIDYRWTCIFFILRSPLLLKLNSRCWCSEQQLVS